MSYGEEEEEEEEDYDDDDDGDDETVCAEMSSLATRLRRSCVQT